MTVGRVLGGEELAKSKRIDLFIVKKAVKQKNVPQEKGVKTRKARQKGFGDEAELSKFNILQDRIVKSVT